jgi:hypothetical protein
MRGRKHILSALRRHLTDRRLELNNSCHNTIYSKMQQVVNSVKSAVGATKLPTGQLGKNGPYVTRMGYGAMGLSAFYGKPKPDEERFAVLDKLYEQGELFWDTAGESSLPVVE